MRTPTRALQLLCGTTRNPSAAAALPLAMTLPPAPPHSASNSASDPDQPGGLAAVFDDLVRTLNHRRGRESVPLRALIDVGGRRAYGPLLLIIGLFAISPATIPPGMTALVAAITLLVALQMAFGLKRPWLPRRALDLQLPCAPLFAFLDRAQPEMQRIASALARPRFEFLTAPPFLNLVALCVAAAALITFPLSLIPLAPLAPSVAVVLFALGMIARDGLLLGVGVALTAAAFWLAGPLVL